jgi:hypothetical protein
MTCMGRVRLCDAGDGAASPDGSGGALAASVLVEEEERILRTSGCELILRRLDFMDTEGEIHGQA